ADAAEERAPQERERACVDDPGEIAALDARSHERDREEAGDDEQERREEDERTAHRAPPVRDMIPPGISASLDEKVLEVLGALLDVDADLLEVDDHRLEFARPLDA